MNYSRILQKYKQSQPEKLFLVWDQKDYSYGQAAERVEHMAELLRAAGVQGNTAAVYADDPVFQLLGFLAVQQAGGIPIVVHEYIKGEDLTLLLRENRIGFLLSDREAGKTLLPFCTGSGMYVYTVQKKGEISFSPAPCMGVLTSGSSSFPKVLFRTFESWADFFKIQDNMFSVSENTRLYIHGSLGFTGNLNMVLDVLCAGGTVIGTSVLRPGLWLEDMQREHISHIYMIPSKLSLLARRVREPIQTVKMILSGSQLMSADSVRKLYRGFPESELILYYGSTELNYVSWITGREILEKPESVGKPFPGVQVEIRGGEIFAHSRYMVCGAPSFCTSGDMGCFDRDGFLLFRGRKTDIYNIKGNQVSRQKILGVLKQMPSVRDAEIIPFHTENGDVKLTAFILSEQREKRKVLSFLRQRLNDWEIPARMLFIDRIPVTSTGKTDYRELRKWAAGGGQK